MLKCTGLRDNMLTPSVIAAVKKTFSRSKFAKEYKNKYVVKGKKGKRGGKIGKCSVCKAHIPLYKLQIDHIDTIVPVMIPAKHMSFIYLFNRTFCDASNLQLICPHCHDKKSKKENKQRVAWRKKKKFLVCRKVLGSRIKVIPITNMKDFDESWEIMSVHKTRKAADRQAKSIRKY